jgi:hypothetical protein
LHSANSGEVRQKESDFGGGGGYLGGYQQKEKGRVISYRETSTAVSLNKKVNSLAIRLHVPINKGSRLWPMFAGREATGRQRAKRSRSTPSVGSCWTAIQSTPGCLDSHPKGCKAKNVSSLHYGMEVRFSRFEGLRRNDRLPRSRVVIDCFLIVHQSNAPALVAAGKRGRLTG